MNQNTKNKLDKIAKKHQGVFTSKDAQKIGISRSTMNRLKKSGIISNIYRDCKENCSRSQSIQLSNPAGNF